MIGLLPLAALLLPAGCNRNGNAATGREALEPGLDHGNAATGWVTLEPGLDLGTFQSPKPSETGDSTVVVVRGDPAFFDVQLLTASSDPAHRLRTAREWATDFGLVAAINASMYDTDYLTAVSLLVDGEHTNQAKLSKDNAVLAFDPVDATVPPVQIIDRECHDFPALRLKYRSLVQGIRMRACDGRNTWAQQERAWSEAALGMDTKGRFLMLFSRSPWTAHDFIDIVGALPIDLAGMQHGDGGPPAQMAVHAGGRDLEFVGSYETGVLQDNGNLSAWKIPNVVGLSRRSPLPGAAREASPSPAATAGGP